jgi:hypothetical protein
MHTPSREQSGALARYLEDVLAGKTSLAPLLESPESHAVAIAPCFHGLHHYLTDEDIRMREPEYREMQEDEMRKMIRLLRDGAPSERLLKISFLARTLP